MLNKFIKLINNGLIHYVKQIEKEHYKPSGSLTVEYVQNSSILARNRKEAIVRIMMFCEESERTLMAPSELARIILQYVNTINSSLGILFNYQSRLQRIMIGTIAVYDPELLRYDGHDAIFVEHHLDDLSSSRQSQNEDTVPVSQLNEFISLMTILREDNKALKERLDKQDKLFDELRTQNLELRETLARAQLEIINFQQQTPLNTGDRMNLS